MGGNKARQSAKAKGKVGLDRMSELLYGYEYGRGGNHIFNIIFNVNKAKKAIFQANVKILHLNNKRKQDTIRVKSNKKPNCTIL